MSELDRLRDAMRITERPDATLDLATVLREGRRLRTRRRVAGAGVATLAAGLAAAVAVVVIGAGPKDLPTVPPPVADAPGPPAATFPTPTITPWHTPAPTTPSSSGADRERPPSPLGQVVDSKVSYGTERRVFYSSGCRCRGCPG
ncbi:hypothetical protein GCM10027614_16880 [Micromonospora vulcania]